MRTPFLLALTAACTALAVEPNDYPFNELGIGIPEQFHHYSALTGIGCNDDIDVWFEDKSIEPQGGRRVDVFDYEGMTVRRKERLRVVFSAPFPSLADKGSGMGGKPFFCAEVSPRKFGACPNFLAFFAGFCPVRHEIGTP